MIPRATCALVALLLASPICAQERDESVALVGATVHTVDGPSLAKGTVVVRGGKIVSVGAEAPPAGMRTVDLSGQHLYPGLIDCSTVLGLVEVSSVKGTVDDKEVGAINPNLRPELAVNPDSELLGVARTGGVLLALIHAGSGLVPGRSALIRTAGWTYEDMTVRAPVFLHVRWPSMRVDRSGRHAKSPAEQVQAREEKLRQLSETLANARAYWRARRAVGTPRVEQDVQWEALRDVLSGATRVAVHADDLTQIEAALTWAEREQVRLVLFGGADAWRCADRLRAADVPVVLGRTFRLPSRGHEAVRTPYKVAARLHAAGVPIAFSTGAYGFAAANARNLRDHAALAVAHGLPESAAVEALSLGAATILGVGDRLGSVSAGKQATLFVTDRPLFDFRSRVTRAWIDGREVSLQDRQRRLYERYKERPARGR